MKKLLKVVAALFLVYSLVMLGFYIVMCQKPGVFGQVMARSPIAVFIVFPFKSMWLSARRGHLRVGDTAPDFSLETRDKKAKVQLSTFRGQKPVALVFGSYTWPPFRREVPELNKLYAQYKDQVEFYLVYIQEAHPSDAWQLPVNERDKIVYDDPKEYEDRVTLASTCSVNLGIEFPALVDTIENSTEHAYTGWPDRLYLVDRSGRIAFKSQPGPFGFDTEALSKAIGHEMQSIAPSAASGGVSKR